MKHQRHIIILHWATVILVLCNPIIIWAREDIDDRQLRTSLVHLHEWFGVTILVLALIRLFSRQFTDVDISRAWLSPAAHRVSRLGHWALYGLLIATPMVGWMTINARGQAIDVFTLFNLPLLVGKNKALAESLGDVHEYLAYALITMIAVHAAAAIVHHYLLGDPTLRSMAPFISPLRRPQPTASEEA